jgi:hypothetical protein
MRDYAKILPKFWDSDLVADAAIDDIYAAHVALYLISAPSSHMCGIFRCSAAQVADDARISSQRAESALTTLEARGFLERDQRRKLIYVKKMAIAQIDERLKPADGRVTSIKNYLSTIADCPIKASFMTDYNELFNLGFSESDINAARSIHTPPSTPPLPHPSDAREQGTGNREQRAGSKEHRAKNTEQEQRALRSQAEDQEQEQKPKACAAEPLAAGAAVTLEGLGFENLNSDSTTGTEATAPDLSKKAVSKRGKAQKTTFGGIDLSTLPQKISVMAAETLVAHRKAKGSPFVQVSFERFVSKVLEASAELSISADDVIFEVIDAGWTGFRIEWLKNRLQSGQKTGGNSRQKFGAMSAPEKSAVRDRVKSGFLDSFVGVNPVDGTTLIEGVEYAKC